jgi:methanogenic corrinoid protein MtbC1
MTVANPIAQIRSRYLAAQLAGDRRRALEFLAEGTREYGLSAVQVQLEVIQEAQREIGKLWQENRITIAQEHMATAISQLALAQSFQSAPSAAPNGRRVLIACVEGEMHEFPTQLAADTLDLAGFEVRFLGANVPTDSLLVMIDRVAPEVLALSCAMAFNVPALRETIRRVRARPGPRLPVLVGGNALAWSPELATSVGADGFGSDALALLSETRRVLGMMDV